MTVFVHKRVGVVESISGLDAVRSSPGVLAADVYFQAGHQIKSVQVDSDRSGYVIAIGLTAAEALARADQAATKLNIRVKPSEPDPDGLKPAKGAEMLDQPTGTPAVSSAPTALRRWVWGARDRTRSMQRPAER